LTLNRETFVPERVKEQVRKRKPLRKKKKGSAERKKERKKRGAGEGDNRPSNGTGGAQKTDCKKERKKGRFAEKTSRGEKSFDSLWKWSAHPVRQQSNSTGGDSREIAEKRNSRELNAHKRGLKSSDKKERKNQPVHKFELKTRLPEKSRTGPAVKKKKKN